jgi:hypothetical protein
LTSMMALFVDVFACVVDNLSDFVDKFI